MVENKKQPTFFLKRVIKRIPNKCKPSTDSSVVIRYPAKGILGGILGAKNTKYFEVFNDTDNRNYAEYKQEVKIKDFDTERSINIVLHYRITCPKGNETKLVNFLGQDEIAEKCLLDYIDKLTHQFYNDKSEEFISNIDQNLKELVEILDRDLENASGLDIKVKAKIKNSDIVDDIDVTDQINIIPKDIDNHIGLNINYILKAKSANLSALFSQDIGNMKQNISNLIKKYISKNIDSNKLFFDFTNNDTEIQKFVSFINKEIQIYGREIMIEQLSLNSLGIKQFEEIEIETKSKPIDRSDKGIFVKNRIQFELVHIGKYLSANQPNLHSWAKSKLDNILAVKVFDWEYIDFLVNFETLRQDIYSAMQEESAKIGYKINQIISEPKLQEYVLLRMDTHNFEFTSLSTADSAVTADFKVTVTFMLSDKSAFRELLKYENDAYAALKKFFEVELKKVLSYETPEAIFLQYYNDRFQGKSESLKHTLEDSIKNSLIDKFKAIVQDIHIVPIENDILKPLYEVRGQSIDIEFDLLPKIVGDPIVYGATLVIHGQDNNNWSKLIEGKYTIDKIKDLVIKTLQAEFNMLSEEELRFKTLEHRRGIEKIADKLAKNAVSKRYGLIVEIENLNRNQNTEEKLASQNKHKQLHYVYGEKESNLEYLRERNRQDREQLLHLSSAIDDDSIQEALEYEKRVGLEDIDIKSYDKPSQEEALSGLQKLAQETQSFDYLDLEQKLTKPSEKKALEQDLDKD
jgi:hypothetical protein